MKTILSFGLLGVLLLALGCGPGEEQRRELERERAAEEVERAAGAGDFAGAMEALGQAMGGGGEGRAEPVARERLRDLLPEEAGGMRRTNISSESQNAMGFAVSQAEATYEGDEGAAVDVKVVDMGNFPGIAMMGLGWAMGEMDRESDQGFERTMRYRGHRGYEKYDDNGRRGELQVLVADRFLVEVDGRNVAFDQIREVADDVDLGDLERMRNEGR